MSEHVHDELAALDLGSNSFHMIIARVSDDGQLQLVDRLKDMVRLGGGLDEEGNLDVAAQERALASLARFGERLRHLPPEAVRVVGTNTLRKARNAGDFLARAEAALGHTIEIVSGREEGRLIYLGVARGVFDPEGRKRLVVDIGGGSTEVIIGEGFDVLACESLYMGCVSFSQRFFKKGKLKAKYFDRAVLAARQELRAIENRYPEMGWELAVGASGTIKAIQSTLTDEEIGELGITLEAMYRLRDRVLAAGHVDDLALEGLSERRAPVFAGGLAILTGLFESLGVERMVVSDFAMREGVLYDLHGRVRDVDVRDVTIDAMAARYMVDQAHAARVERAAFALLDQVREPWGLGARVFSSQLRWACRLHEIGLAISHGRYHKHGSYLVKHSDMAGFSRQDQQLLWALIRSHRRRFKPHRFEGLPGDLPARGRRLCVLLRLSVLLNRGRSDGAYPDELVIEVDDARVRLRFPEGWLEQSPLTVEELRMERDYLAQAGFTLDFDERS